MKLLASQPRGWAAFCGYLALPLSLTGVAIQAFNTPYTRYTFVLFLVAAVLWLMNALLTLNCPMAILQLVLIFLDAIAVWRWF